MAGVGRVFQGVEYPSRREACQARHREYVRALADGLNFTQAAHAVGVSKRTGKVWRNGRTRSSGRCERASIAPQAHWYRLYMKCQPHRISQRFLSLKERMLILGWRIEGFSIRDIARQLGRSPSTVCWELRHNGWACAQVVNGLFMRLLSRPLGVVRIRWGICRRGWCGCGGGCRSLRSRWRPRCRPGRGW